MDMKYVKSIDIARKYIDIRRSTLEMELEILRCNSIGARLNSGNVYINEREMMLKELNDIEMALEYVVAVNDEVVLNKVNDYVMSYAIIHISIIEVIEDLHDIFKDVDVKVSEIPDSCWTYSIIEALNRNGALDVSLYESASEIDIKLFVTRMNVINAVILYHSLESANFHKKYTAEDIANLIYEYGSICDFLVKRGFEGAIVEPLWSPVATKIVYGVDMTKIGTYLYTWIVTSLNAIKKALELDEDYTCNSTVENSSSETE